LVDQQTNHENITKWLENEAFRKIELGFKNKMESKSILDSVMQCFSCCGTKNDAVGAEHVLQPLNLYNPRAQTSVEQLIGQSEDTRLRLFSKLGSLQDFILTQAAPNGVVGAPRWPTASQKFRVINRPNGTALIVSDGLSDPFDDLQSDANVNGYGLEFFIETPATEVGPDPSELKSSWQFQLLYTVCSLAAGHGGIRSIIDDMQLLSTEAEGVGEAIPTDYKAAVVNRAGRVGALLGLTESDPGSQSCELKNLAMRYL
jgi:hypothetical protein